MKKPKVLLEVLQFGFLSLSLSLIYDSTTNLWTVMFTHLEKHDVINYGSEKVDRLNKHKNKMSYNQLSIN